MVGGGERKVNKYKLLILIPDALYYLVRKVGETFFLYEKKNVIL